MVTFISDNEHGWVFQAPLDMLPCWTPSHAAAFIVSPRVWRTLDWFLPVLPPRILIWRNISKLVANSRHFDRSLDPQLPPFRAVASAAGSTLAIPIFRSTRAPPLGRMMHILIRRMRSTHKLEGLPIQTSHTAIHTQRRHERTIR